MRCISCPGVYSLFCFNLERMRYLEWMFAVVNAFHASPIKSNRIFPNEKLKHLDLFLNILCRPNQVGGDAELATLPAKIVQIFADCAVTGLAVSKRRIGACFIYSENLLYVSSPCRCRHSSCSVRDGNGLYGSAVKGQEGEGSNLRRHIDTTHTRVGA